MANFESSPVIKPHPPQTIGTSVIHLGLSVTIQSAEERRLPLLPDLCWIWIIILLQFIITFLCLTLSPYLIQSNSFSRTFCSTSPGSTYHKARRIPRMYQHSGVSHLFPEQNLFWVSDCHQSSTAKCWGGILLPSPVPLSVRMDKKEE